MRALLSVSDKTGVIDFARGLIDRGVELVSTGGTARALAEADVAVTGVSAVTGFPEMMDGRVKTLHPAVHGGILARRHRPDDLAAIAGQGITPIDLVVVNLYPFAQTAASDASVDELIEQIDIGGPSMVRAAAKNFEDVLIVVDPADYGRVLELLDLLDARDASTGGDPPDRHFRFELARKAFAHTADYDATIAAALDAVEMDGAAFTRSPLTLHGIAPDHLHIRATKLRDLRYGENPHQAAALYADRNWGFGSRARPAGEGAVVHQPAGSRRRRAAGPRVRRARRRGDQAHQPMRRGNGREPARRVCHGARGGPAVGVRGHRRVEPAARRRDRGGHRGDVHRVRRRPGGGRRGARGAGEEEEPPPGGG